MSIGLRLALRHALQNTVVGQKLAFASCEIYSKHLITRLITYVVEQVTHINNNKIHHLIDKVIHRVFDNRILHVVDNMNHQVVK